MSNEKKKPLWKRKSRNLEVALWKNENTDPQKAAFFSVSLTRSYKVGDEWKKQTLNLSEDELHRARDLCRTASDALADAVFAARAEESDLATTAGKTGDRGDQQ